MIQEPENDASPLESGFKGSWIHLQNEEFLQDYCSLSGQSLFKFNGFFIRAKKHPLLGHLIAYLYSPEIIRRFTEVDAKQFHEWLRTNNIAEGLIYTIQECPFLPNMQTNGGTLYFDLSKDESELWDNMEGRCRKAIRKAEKGSVTINIDDGLKHFKRWYEIYSSLAIERSFSMQSEKVIRGLLTKGWGKLVTAWDGEILLGGVFFVFTNYCIPLAAGFGSGPEFRKHSPGNLMFWETIKFAKRSNMRYFDFMGTDDDPSHGPTNFKKSFGGEFVRVYEYTIAGKKGKKVLLDTLLRTQKTLSNLSKLRNYFR